MALFPPKDLDVSKQASRRGMSYTYHLIGLALTAVWGSHNLEGVEIPHHLEIAPERGGDAAVVRMLHHGGELAMLDELSPLATKLEFVARVVDRPGAVRLHIDTALHGRNHLCQAGIARLQV